MSNWTGKKANILNVFSSLYTYILTEMSAYTLLTVKTFKLLQKKNIQINVLSNFLFIKVSLKESIMVFTKKY